WDMPYLGMQVLIEGLALAAFGMIRDTTTKPLPKQILAYVMQDEARHVAFGRMALRDYYRQISDAERREREEFVIEGCYLMRDRLSGVEVLENFGVGGQEAKELTEHSEFLQLFRKLLFSRIVPCVKDIGLWGERLQKAYVDMGVLELGDSSLDLLMAQDEEIAEQLDKDRFEAEERARVAEVAEAVAQGVAEA
ncbi:aminobenzoate oxygenase, partial [Streptomyces rubiginosohelvolus]